jgi:hypothetical protein
VACLWPLLLLAQEPGAQIKQTRAVRTDTPPVIDGRLDEEVWLEARAVEDLHQIWPIEYAEATERSIIYVLYDEEALYIGARLLDTEPDQITARVLRQGERPGNNDDYFGVIVSPFNDQRSGYLFEVNPNGVRSEALYQDTNRTQFDWQGIWHASSTIDGRGWVTEIAIPFKTLSFDADGDTWGINFLRRVARKRETMGWVSRNRSLNPGVSGEAIGFSGLQQGMGLDIVPSLSMNESKDFSATGKVSDIEPSLDVFYKFTPELTGVLTLNTDFSATEIDDRQVNLTRFDLFFPEKRDFFLQDADIFEFGRIGSGMGSNANNGRPFFSRTIGLSEDREPIDLAGGVKLTGRVGPWNLGMLGVRQEQYQDLGATDLFVGRAVANVLEESSVGVIFTDGDPQSNLDNSLYGVDFRYSNSRLPSGRKLEAEAWYQRSDTPGLEDEDEAFGFGIRRNSFEGLTLLTAFKEVQENFNPALGFVNQVGIRRINAAAQYSYRPAGRYFRLINARLGYFRAERISDGSLETELLDARIVDLQNHSGDRLTLRFRPQREGLIEDFEIIEGVFIPTGEYRFDRYRMELRTGGQRRLSGGLTYEAGDFFGGERVNITPQLNWRPSEHFRLNLSYQFNDVDLPQGAFTTRLVRFRTDVVFSSRLSWVNLIQWDDDSEVVSFNSRLHWVPQAGREAFLVLNHNLQDEDENQSFHSQNADLTLKFNYTFRY